MMWSWRWASSLFLSVAWMSYIVVMYAEFMASDYYSVRIVDFVFLSVMVPLASAYYYSSVCLWGGEEDHEG